MTNHNYHTYKLRRFCLKWQASINLMSRKTCGTPAGFVQISCSTDAKELQLIWTTGQQISCDACLMNYHFFGLHAFGPQKVFVNVTWRQTLFILFLPYGPVVEGPEVNKRFAQKSKAP